MLTQDDMYILEHAFYFISTILHKSTDIIPASLDLCLKYLQRYLEPLPRDHIHDPKVQISAVGLIWVNIELGDGIKKIINTGLVYVMLDILNKTVFPVKIVILGALVDLCDTGACIPHLITWRKHGKKLLPLLMEIFREESLKLGVKTGPNGEIDGKNCFKNVFDKNCC
ncbi:unnamed protein product [Brassicogethes aeneus]|uniref:Cilia- and flagella-associated protein 69 ARM repeats domain-containing protein n=1 Tax=Brassicogethes aeneus TaxID=1431903 RepID=A0A9P0B626_BRAAE|nr:unnamed protein product [Brassicogethes aeneus]